MPATESLATMFEAERPRLRAIAAGILGSIHEADDAVQEAWLRLDRADASEIRSIEAWVTVVVSRIALDHVRARTSRNEVTIDALVVPGPAANAAPESSALLEESVYEALSRALDRLSPLEAATFILHDLFVLPFDDIASIIDRSPAATRKLASRARQKIATDQIHTTPVRSRREIIEAFLHAAGTGDLSRLIATLAPDAVLLADPATQQLGSKPETVGANEVAGHFLGRAQAARVIWIDGAIGAGWIEHGRVRVAFNFEFQNGVIQQISLRSDPEYLTETEFELENVPRRRNRDPRSRI